MKNISLMRVTSVGLLGLLLSGACVSADTLSGQLTSAFYAWNWRNNAEGTGSWGADAWIAAGQNTDQLQRAIVGFALPDLPQGHEVVSAKLTFAIATGASGSTSRIGDLSIYHSQTANPPSGNGAASYYQDPSYNQLVTSSAATPSSAAWQIIEIDVTDVIRLDYLNDLAGAVFSSFRFQVDGLKYGTGTPASEFYGDTNPHRYTINKGNIGLTIETAPAIPEPASIGVVMAAGGVFFAAASLRRRLSAKG